MESATTLKAPEVNQGEDGINKEDPLDVDGMDYSVVATTTTTEKPPLPPKTMILDPMLIDDAPDYSEFGIVRLPLQSHPAPTLDLTYTQLAKKKRTDNEEHVKPPVSIDLMWEITDRFCQKNFLAYTMFGKLYRGKMPCGDSGKEKNVIVKRWMNIYRVTAGPPFEERLMRELRFLESPPIKSHPSFVKVIGYCVEGFQKRCTIYDVDPKDTLSNLIVKDDFSWTKRIEVARKLAQLLEHLQKEDDPFVVRNLDADYIIIDQDFNPKIIDFARIRHQNKGNEEKATYIFHNFCYDAPEISAEGGKYYVESDVYSYGVILLSLIAKRIGEKHEPEDIFCTKKLSPRVGEWAVKEFGRTKTSLVHDSLLKEVPLADLGMEITELGLSCLDSDRAGRPKLSGIVSALNKWCA